MTHALRIASASLFCLFLVAGDHSAVQAQTAAQTYERVKARYRNVQAVQARFSQVVRSEFNDETITAEGTVVMQGSKYRVETGAQTLVTDGKVTWVYVPAEKQVLINDYVADETTFSLNDFFFKHANEYNVVKGATTTQGGQKHHVLTLRPKQREAFFTEVVLTLRDRDLLVTGLDVKDVNGTRMTFTLRDIQVNPALRSGIFTFQPPRGVEVVDLRS